MIRLVVDSSSDFSKEEIEQLNISCVPIQVSFNGHHYYDGVDLDKNTFYDLLSSTEEFPKTSQPSPNEFLEIFEAAKRNHGEVVCILLSSALSGTYQSALLAKQMCEYDKIYLIDSLSATCGIRLLVNCAMELIEKGLSAKEIFDHLEKIKHQIRIVAGVDTLEYLCKGGRVSRTAATIGGLANIKPIICVNSEGKVDVLGKKIGLIKAIKYIEEQIKSEDIDHDYPVYTVYTYGEDNLNKLEDKLNYKGIKSDKRVQIGATIGAHVGPGAFGICYIEKIR